MKSFVHAINLAFLCVASLLVPSLATAHTVVEVPLEQLAASADRVVIGQVTQSISRWEDDDRSRRIVTYHAVQVESNIVGEGGKTVWVRRLGGVVGNIGQRVHGVAPLQDRQRFLLFLKPRTDSTFYVVGMEQGCFKIDGDSIPKWKVAPSALAHPPLPSKVRQTPTSVLYGLAVPELTALIRKARANHAK